jgi:succinate dehydrogenase / fumarate reductase iron-sulfur subunit
MSKVEGRIEGKEEEKRKKITLKVYRTNYNNKKESPHYDEFEVPVNRWTTVLDALLYAKK